MSIVNGIITNMGKKIAADGIGGDLQAAFHSSQKRQSWYFSDAPIKMGAKYKPFLNTTVIFASQQALDDARAAANYGLSIPSYTSPTDLIGADWSIHRPNGTDYPRRAQQDFEKYYMDAEDVPACCTWPDDDITVNIINSNSATTVPFFAYQKTGQLKDWRPDSVAGMVAPSSARSNTQIDAICALSELNASGGAVITSLTEPYMGLAIFEGSTFKKFVGCPHPLVASQNVRDIDMYQLRSADITGLQGSYTAVACIRYKRDSINYGYIPLPKGTSEVYKNLFNLKIGGAEFYKYWQRGIAETNIVSDVQTLTTTASNVYVTIRVQNNSGIAHQSSGTNADGWLLYVTISGSIVAGGITKNINRTTGGLSIRNYYPGAMQFLTIPKDGTTDITFLVPKVWNQNESDPAEMVESGMVVLTCNLKYVSGGVVEDFDRAPTSQQPTLSISYGN